jgi:hypothetical protein
MRSLEEGDWKSAFLLRKVTRWSPILLSVAFGRGWTETGWCKPVPRWPPTLPVMRKLLVTAYSLLKNSSTYDPKKVWAGSTQLPEDQPILQIA